MLGSLIDQTLKIFNRGFLIAAFFPTVLFGIVCAAAWFGLQSVEEWLKAVGKADWQSIALQLVVGLGGAYLLAFVIYGIRPTLHRVYQGRWVNFLRTGRSLDLPTRWLAIWLREREREAKVEWSERADEEAAGRDVALWVRNSFGKTFHRKPIAFQSKPRGICEKVKFWWRRLRRRERSEKQLQNELTGLDNQLSAMLSALDSRSSISAEDYQQLLRRAHHLFASRSKFPQSLTHQVESLVQRFASAQYSKKTEYLRLAEAVEQMDRDAEGKRILAHGKVLETFPDDDALLCPTRLGNVTMVMETYPWKRYGIYLSSLWPRMREIISAETSQRVDECGLFLDFAVIMSTLAYSAALVTLTRSFAGTGPAALPHVWVTLVLFVAGYGFYRLAISATQNLNGVVQAAIDLFRFKILDTMGIEKPQTPEQERMLWAELHLLFVQADSPKTFVKFTHKKEKDDSASRHPLAVNVTLLEPAPTKPSTGWECWERIPSCPEVVPPGP